MSCKTSPSFISRNKILGKKNSNFAKWTCHLLNVCSAIEALYDTPMFLKQIPFTHIKRKINNKSLTHNEKQLQCLQ